MAITKTGNMLMKGLRGVGEKIKGTLANPFLAAGNGMWVGQNAYDVATGERSLGDAIGDVAVGTLGFHYAGKLGDRLTRNMKKPIPFEKQTPGGPTTQRTWAGSALNLVTTVGVGVGASMFGSAIGDKIMPWQRQPKTPVSIGNNVNPGDFAQQYQTYPE